MKFRVITLCLIPLEQSQTKPFSFFNAPHTQSIRFIYNYKEDTIKRSEERVSRKISLILKLPLSHCLVEYS